MLYYKKKGVGKTKRYKHSIERFEKKKYARMNIGKEQIMWNKIKWYIQRFMIGRNGKDELMITVANASLILYIFAPWFDKLLPFPIFRTFCWIGVFYSLFRVCSKDVYRRREENRKFLQEVEFFKLRISMRKTHRIYRCKGCGRKIRVPKGKGKIEISCPLCGNKFIRRT